MPLALSVSGSTILSARERLDELFTWGTSAIEAGGFDTMDDLRYVVQQCRDRGIQFGLHTPSLRHRNRHGLLYGEEDAWSELQEDLELAWREGFAYVLIHFPFFREPMPYHEALSRIRNAVGRMHEINRHHVRIVAEPKLGPKRDPFGISVLLNTAGDEISDWKMDWCIDVGDLYMACETLGYQYEEHVKHLAQFAKVTHLHHVEKDDDHYYWTPVTSDGCVPIAHTLEMLARNPWDTYVVLEHTPHRARDQHQVLDGIEWLIRTGQYWRSTVGRSEGGRT